MFTSIILRVTPPFPLTTPPSSRMFSPTSFIPCTPLLPKSTQVPLLSHHPWTRPRRHHPLKANLNSVPNTPSLLVSSWAKSRSISSTIDLSRHFISLLFLSNNCRRAAYAEKQLTQVAEAYSVSRRLLVLSAGLYSRPGDLLPWKLVAAARRKGIDMSEERPCASFDISDLEYYDFIIVVDRNVKEHIMRMAESFAHTTGGHLYEWERKVRLLCDFDARMPHVDRVRSGIPLDVPSFESSSEVYPTMDLIKEGCESIVRSLVRAGL